MPRQPTVTEIRLDNLADCLAPTVILLHQLNDAFTPPFVEGISRTIASLIKLIQVLGLAAKMLVIDPLWQNVKQNKKECAQLLENMYQVLLVILNLHIKSEAAGSLSPTMSEHVGKFMKTPHNIYAYLEALQDGNKIKQLFLWEKWRLVWERVPASGQQAALLKAGSQYDNQKAVQWLSNLAGKVRELC
ncbi:hypothetical protein C8R45DRAFT_932905 [Mycena sanguinolenta]|nr:hypothetical protein C8R45DRAFT_932905 [Mycena sanguinolenta]